MAIRAKQPGAPIDYLRGYSVATNQTSGVQQLLKSFDITIKNLTFFGQSLLFVLVVSLAIFSISELAARDTMQSLLSARITALKSDFVERTRVKSVQTKAPSAQSGSDGTPQIDALPRGEQEMALNQIQEIDALRRATQSLAALGTDNNVTLRRIEKQFRLVSDGVDQQLVGNFDAAAQTRGASSTTAPSLVEHWIASIPGPSFLLTLSSDQLLAIVVLACGAIGAMISSLRAHQSLSLYAFVIGLASGFVSFLVIKGGKHVFLLQTQGEVVAFNPYGSAFAGLLAGLFTEKAHQLLAIVVNDLAERLRAAAQASPAKASRAPAKTVQPLPMAPGYAKSGRAQPKHPNTTSVPAGSSHSLGLAGLEAWGEKRLAADSAGARRACREGCGDHREGSMVPSLRLMG